MLTGRGGRCALSCSGQLLSVSAGVPGSVTVLQSRQGIRLKKVTVQAYEDMTRTEGGHAAILLHGVASIPSPFFFRVRLADVSRTGERSGGWIGGSHTPVASRSTDQGFEVIAGPSLTENELLLPGAVVEIEVPAGDVCGEFLWPNVAPLMRPRKKSVLVGRQKSAAKPALLTRDSAGVATQDAIASAAPPISAILPEAAPTAAAGANPNHNPAAADVPSDVHPAGFDRASAALASAQRDAKPEREARDDGEVDMRPRQPPEAPGHGPIAHETPESISEKYGWAFRKDVSVMLSKKFFALGDSRHDKSQEEAVSAHRGEAAHNIAADATAILAHQHDEPNHAIGADMPFPVSDHHLDADVAPAGETFYPHARGSLISAPAAHAHTPMAAPARPGPSSLRSSGISSLLAALATLLVGGVAGVMLLSGQSNVGSADAALRTPAVAAAPVASGGEALPANALFEALAVGATSPRGVSAAGVPLPKTLENANVQLLAAGAARDTEEGAFWLKQFITGTLGDERTVRVLTQLGSVYAEPNGGVPDFAKARLLWEVASAAGDPVAMCFLGLLHENGLGVSADKGAARQWYQRSKDKGGCPNVDESLARVRQ